MSSSSMSSTGRTEQDTTPLRGWLWLVALLGVVICGGVISIQVLSVVVALLFPPPPPQPASVVETTYQGGAWGEGTWTYTSTQSACVLATFYAALGVCEQQYPCQAGQSLPSLTRVAVCEGHQPFSQFSLRWRAVISTDEITGQQSRLRLERRILWTSDSPAQVTPTHPRTP